MSRLTFEPRTAISRAATLSRPPPTVISSRLSPRWTRDTEKPVITDSHSQSDTFKKLGLKRTVSFGGWAYSTEPATHKIIRRTIIDNRKPGTDKSASIAAPASYWYLEAFPVDCISEVQGTYFTG
ncbi:hypothetical protein LZ30DRAFT_783629 [Colletotrichum cereale]|nr:hypothetical protein LZ30DRAFT_783629 [Colletotrichum cereale]